MRKIYKEDDWMALVEILEDLSDDEFDRFKLKVVRTIRPSKIFKPVPNGTEFQVEQRKDSPGICWSMRDDWIAPIMSRN
jgi:hypothetical protein